jgi:hypothetical protein
MIDSMKQFVVDLQKVMAALSKDNSKAAAEALHSLGMQSMSDAQVSFKHAIPQGFRMMAIPFHKSVACHASYRIQSK